MADGRYTFERPVLHHREILQFVIFKMASVHHLAIVKLKFLTANHFKDTCSIITLNFVVIGRTIAQRYHIFFIFSKVYGYS